MVNEGKKRKNDKRNKKKNKNETTSDINDTPNLSDEEQTILTHTEEQHEESEDETERQHDDDSDAEDKPRKKKKKNKPVADETGEKKGKKSIRQMKREKHAQRLAEAKAASKDNLKTQCLSYLSQWKHDKQNWKFMKVKQVWLFKNKFSQNLIPDASWPLLLEYFDSAKGNIRNLLLEDANKVIKQMDAWVESQKDKKDEDTEETEGPTKPDQTSYKRARDIIQCLQE